MDPCHSGVQVEAVSERRGVEAECAAIDFNITAVRETGVSVGIAGGETNSEIRANAIVDTEGQASGLKIIAGRIFGAVDVCELADAVIQTPQRFSGVGVITDGPLLPSGPLTPARPLLKLGALPFNVKPAALKPLLPARTSSMRRFRLAVCTFARETPMLKIDANSSGAIRPKSLQSLLSGSSSREEISVDARAAVKENKTF